MKLDDKRIRIIIGHYGSGKTEFAVNYARMLKKEAEQVAVCDLDIVNPYFRSREKAEILQAEGITVISGAFGHNTNLDLPMLSPSILAPLQNENAQVILDVGGDAVGARVLARYKEYFTEGEYDMFCVVNAYREQTQDLMGVVSHIRKIEDTVGVKVTGLINNTHLLRDTTVEDVMKGQQLVVEVSKKLNIPIKYVSTLEKVTHQLPEDIEGKILPIAMLMREDWM
ncbi:nucleotide-binding protein [Fusibacter tunisiensis]|uniref:tRNA uridine 5-carbamoylmethylation protein Kti12 n=1 Tax=Fusibacter tunisiensis TaxID=1008308 RepID=A0ABS2MTW0_9FIRM|nr:ATP-binding protein [Fusibacter tunisiensis]MBM7562812.1 tRNA uridine 5-carbamoylmethylation protein Kti12 [Fusibacter tunisiensis]